MLTEFDIRQTLDEIEESNMHPLRKARRLMAIARKAQMESRRVGQAVAILSRDCMDDQAERMQRAKHRLVDLNREVMDRARLILARAKHAGTGYDASAPVTYQASKG